MLWPERLHKSILVAVRHSVQSWRRGCFSQKEPTIFTPTSAGILYLSRLPQSSSVDSRFLFVEVYITQETPTWEKWVWWPGHEMGLPHVVVGQGKCCLPQLPKPSVPSTLLHCDMGDVHWQYHTRLMALQQWCIPAGSSLLVLQKGH